MLLNIRRFYHIFFNKTSKQIRRVRDRVSDPKIPENLIEQAKGSAVDIAGDQYFISRFEQAQHRRDGGETRCECKARSTALQLRDQCFEGRAGRVAGAGVLPAGILPQPLLLIGGGLIDRHVDRAGGLVSIDTAMYQGGFQVSIARHSIPLLH